MTPTARLMIILLLVATVAAVDDVGHAENNSSMQKETVPIINNVNSPAAQRELMIPYVYMDAIDLGNCYVFGLDFDGEETFYLVEPVEQRRCFVNSTTVVVAQRGEDCTRAGGVDKLVNVTQWAPICDYYDYDEVCGIGVDDASQLFPENCGVVHAAATWQKTGVDNLQFYCQPGQPRLNLPALAENATVKGAERCERQEAPSNGTQGLPTNGTEEVPSNETQGLPTNGTEEAPTSNGTEPLGNGTQDVPSGGVRSTQTSLVRLMVTVFATTSGVLLL